MKFEISFDENIYNKQMDLLFDLAWKRKTDYYKNAQYLGVVLIIIGVFLICKRPNIFGIGYVFLFFGLSNLTPFMYYFFKIKKQYKKLNIAKMKDIEILKKIKSTSFEINEDTLVISTQGNSKFINWNDFEKWTVKDDNLIIITKDYIPYVLGKDEVGLENFEKIIAFVKTKIRIEL